MPDLDIKQIEPGDILQFRPDTPVFDKDALEEELLMAIHCGASPTYDGRESGLLYPGTTLKEQRTKERWGDLYELPHHCGRCGSTTGCPCPPEKGVR